ncbi:MAG: hypothetical protein K9N51_02300 [Candidatus Pacebacteria bacterium]|nr:hypothetical protein [Candidatus Paceibacterota bacterium]
MRHTLQRILSIGFAASLVIAVLITAGCATPARRIRKNPETFASLSQDIQKKVQNGEIALGFPKKAVYLALGAPDRTYRRTTETGSTLMWSYVRSYTDYSGTWWPPRHRVLVTAEGGTRWYRTTLTDSFWHSRVQREYEYLRVEFENDRVITIERLAEDD